MNAILEKEYKKYKEMRICDEANLKAKDINVTALLDKVHWESNSFVKINPNIPKDKVIKKTTTDKFPANAITVRFIRMRDKVVTVYFYGESKVLNYGSGKTAMTWRSINQKLHVTLPFKANHDNFLWGYSFQGNLPDNFTLDEMVTALEHINREVDRMAGN